MIEAVLNQMNTELLLAYRVRRRLNERFNATLLRFDPKEFVTAENFSNYFLNPLTLAVARGIISEEQLFQTVTHYTKI